MIRVWQQRIRHFDRSLKPLERLRVRKGSRQRALREWRARPSRALPLELVFEELRMHRGRGAESSEDRIRRRAKLEFAVVRTRLLERKRNALAKIRARRITKQTSGINLWRTRIQWLADVEALRGRADQLGAGIHNQ